MEFVQRNVFGDNVVNVTTFPDRELTAPLQDELSAALAAVAVTLVAIHFEYDGETTHFVEKISNFLVKQGYTVTRTPHQQSGIQRETLTIEPGDGCAYLRVGTR
jgi:hypothetical protein